MLKYTYTHTTTTWILGWTGDIIFAIELSKLYWVLKITNIDDNGN